MKGNKVLKLVVMVGVLTLVLGAGQAMAQGLTANLEVSASVGSGCDITANPLAFGTYDPLSTTPKDGTGSVGVRCTRGTTATIALSDGAHPSSGQRRMANGGGTEYLPYDLFMSSASYAPANRWGSSSPNLVSYTATNHSRFSINVFGRIPAGTDVPSGASFTDTVVATVNF